MLGAIARGDPMSSHAKIAAKSLCAAIVTLALSSFSIAAAQSTIGVPANQPTIQAAINAANNGDTVLVAPGTYVENINFDGKAITVISSGGSSVTIIDGNHNGTVVTFNHSETLSSVLSGFTIRNGFQDGGFGAGITITSASPTITSNLITGNHAAVAIGIYVNGGSPLISNNTITANDQTGAGDGGLGGGGIAVSGTSSNASNPQIINNTITNNSVAAGGDGGGISVMYFSSPLIQGNLISGNTAYNNGGGISLNSYNSPAVSDNLILNNNSGSGGSGGGLSVFARNGATVNVINNTIVGNTASDSSSGVFTTGWAQNATLANNIVIAAAGQTSVTCSTLWSSVSAIFSFNDVYSATGVFWTAACDFTSNPGNISVDPLFIDSALNFRLQSSSPAVDAGSNSAPGLPATDLDGNPRIVDGNGDGNAVVDLGAYELQPTTITLSPNALTFTAQPTGTTSSPQTVTLTNTGSQKLYLSLSVNAPFGETDDCGGLVAAGSSCSISVTFAPVSTGSFTGGITLRDNAPQNPQTISLNGTGGIPTATIAPGSLSLGGQAVGTTGSAQTVTLTNSGNGPLTISSIIVNGDFSQTSNCVGLLAAGASCSINVTFTPTAAGSRQGSLTVADNASGSPQTVSLTGTGLAPRGSLAPVNMVFSAQPVGTSSAPQTATLSNAGNLGLNLSSIGVSGPFSQTNNCGTALAPGATCAINVTFSPSVVGLVSGALTVVDGSGKTYAASLGGTGADFSVAASPASASVARGGSIAYTITLNPLGGAFGDFVALSCSGLPAGSSCSFSPQNPTPGANGAASVLTVATNQPSTPLGTFALTVIGNSGALSHSTHVQLTVTKPKR